MTNDTVPADKLRQSIEQWEGLEREKKKLSERQKEIMQEAVASGFDAKIIRKVIALRKLRPDEREEQEAVLAMYKEVLGL